MNQTATPRPPVKTIRGERIDVKEAARRINYSPSWIYDKRKKDELPFPYLQTGPGKYAFDSADVDDYVALCWRNTGDKEN